MHDGPDKERDIRRITLVKTDTCWRAAWGGAGASSGRHSWRSTTLKTRSRKRAGCTRHRSSRLATAAPRAPRRRTHALSIHKAVQHLVRCWVPALERTFMRSTRGIGNISALSEGGGARQQIWGRSRPQRARMWVRSESRSRPGAQSPAQSHTEAPVAPMLVQIRALSSR